MPLRTSLIAALGTALVLAPVAVGATVPSPSTDEAVITVRVGGDRVSGAITDTGPADAALTGLAGTRLGLFASATDTTPLPQAWATCISDADGDCSFRVPGTAVGGPHRDARFTVKQLSAPAGWSTNPVLRTENDLTGHANTPYQFLTGPELRAGQTYSSLSDFMYAPATADHFSDVSASSGVWQQSRVNPSIVDQCGLDVALILDTSSSVGSALPQLVAAADSLVDGLTGTRSRVAAFSFAALSPGAQAGPNHPELRSVSTAAGADAVKQEYADWEISVGTNWDRGLFVAAAAAEHYDVAVLITDGNPTLYGDPQPVVRSVTATRFKELEYGIASANALKAEGTRVLAIGVGTGIGLAPLSGPVLYDGSNALQADRFGLADYQAAGAALHQVATELCTGSLSVVTELVPAGNAEGDVSGSAPVGAGWEVAATSPSAGLTGLPSTATTADDGTGAVTFTLGFTPGASSAPVTVSHAAAGYHVVPHDGQNAVCRELGSQAALTVVGAEGAAGSSAFTVEAQAHTAITCTVYAAADDTALFGTLSFDPVSVEPRIAAIHDVDHDGSLGAGDEIDYEFGVDNVGPVDLHNLRVVSPVLGAVVCPSVEIAASASTTCVAHAPYVVTAEDVAAGSVFLEAHVLALDPDGAELTSASATLTRPTGLLDVAGRR